MKDLEIRTTEELLKTMEGVSFEKSCLDMGWKWEVEYSSRQKMQGGLFTGIGWLIRCSFRRPERDSGEVGTGYGRWWYIEEGATTSAVEKTMFLAAKVIVDHELMEAFKVDGLRPFDPHRTIEELTSIARR